MQSKVTDESLARYLSGKSTSDEETLVLDYLSESDEHLNDVLSMTAAVERFGSVKLAKRTLPLWRPISAAASVALLIGFGLAFWQHNMSGSLTNVTPAPAYADMDSITVTNQEEAL